ncbi:YoaK family protein [Paraburkholderia sp.]|uniref:YoaK family protein n=1 Tax=Paraburkholderia sp. TaxID=1926495 RepID=UPI002F3EDF88
MTSTPTPNHTLAQSITRAVLLSAAAGYVEVIGYLDFNGRYPGIMTGNTVQFGYAAISRDWAAAAAFGVVLALFFAGCLCGGIARRVLSAPRYLLLGIAAVVAVADLLRANAALHLPGELPLLALAMAMQGETMARFGGQSIQTIVVTTNIVKCADALVAAASAARRRSGASRDALRTAALPGCAWLGYSGGVIAGAIARNAVTHPLLVAAFMFVCVALGYWRDDF